jgi:hypothetical protein
VIIPNIHFSEPLQIECREFIECITLNAPNHSSGRFGLKVVEVLEEAEQSLLNGGQQETLFVEEDLLRQPLPA